MASDVINQMNAWKSYVSLLVDPDASDENKLKAAQEIAGDLEAIISSPQYPSFLEHAVNIFSRVLSEGQPLFIAEHTGQQLRKLILEIIQKLPVNEHLRLHSKTLISLMFQLLDVENEENVLVILKVISVLHKNHPPPFSAETQNFLAFITRMYQDLPNNLSKIFETKRPLRIKDITELTNQLPVLINDIFTRTPVITSRKNTNLNITPKATHSLKVLAELPNLLVLIYHLYKFNLKQGYETLIPMIFNIFTLQPVNQHRTGSSFNKEVFIDFVAAQIKALSLAQLVITEKESIDIDVIQFVKGFISILVNCPREVVHLKKEVLVAAGLILMTDLKSNSVLCIDQLFDENTLNCKDLNRDSNDRSSTDLDIKTVVDTGFRDILHGYIRSHEGNDDYQWYEKLLEFSIKAARSGICMGSLPIILLTDLFDCKQLSQCEELFSLLESRVDIWKEDIFFVNVKNQMLRSCNDLLRRLSRSQHTVFGGRILEFLARFFPLFERSGLNLTAEINQENVVAISAQEDLPDASVISDSSMEEGEMDSSEAIQVDYNLYRKFWQLQSFFKNPNLCYSKPNWKQFQAYSSDVLTAFSTFKLDSQITGGPQQRIQGEQIHFTKYLTNQKLLELQLSDSNFRRYILVQFLILFQYLTTYVKSKQESQTLTEEQNTWLKQSGEKVLDLISKTPPNGQEMRKIIEHILKREEFWCNWKNDNCSGLKEINEPTSKEPMMSNGRKRVGDEIKFAELHGKVIIGNPELTKLWNLCSDNLEACLSKKRIFIPPVDEFFKEAKTAHEEYSAEERQKMLSDDSDFNWRSLRLLSSKSSHFFTPSNQSMVKPIVQYLDTVIEKVVKELNAADGNKGSQDLAIDDTEDISNDELLKQVDENSNLGSNDNRVQNETKKSEEKASV